MNRSLIVMILTLCALPAWAEQVYVWVDSNGVTHFSQHAPSSPDAASPIIEHQLQTFPEHSGRDPDLEKIWQTANALEQSRLATERARAEKLAAQRAAAQQPPLS